MKFKKINVRLDLNHLDTVANRLGVDRSKAIRASLCCADFVLRDLFGGEIDNIFRRDPKDEKKSLYK